jgi:hypothetical protein
VKNNGTGVAQSITIGTVGDPVVTRSIATSGQVLVWIADNAEWIARGAGKIAAVVTTSATDLNVKSLIVYNAKNLSVQATIPFPGIETAGASLSTLTGESAPAKIAVSDKYAISGWREYSGSTVHKAGILIGALTGGKTGTIELKTLFDDPSAANIGSVVTKGDYAIISNSDGAAGVYKIDASGASITLQQVTAPAEQPEAPWMIDNGSYVLETSDDSSQGGWLRIWKWNGAGAPSIVGVIEDLDTNGAVRAITFDSKDPGIAYHLNRTTREISKIDLASAKMTVLFTITEYTDYPGTLAAAQTGGPNTSSIWNIQKETYGDSAYYILGGSVGQNNRGNGLVFVLKDPPEDGSDITASVSDYLATDVVNWLLGPNGAALGSVRSTRTLTDSKGNIYYVAKALTAPYGLRVVKIN